MELKLNQYNMKIRNKYLMKYYIINSIPNYIFYIVNYNLKYNYIITSPKYINNLIVFFYYNHNFQNKVLSDIVSVDFLDKEYRFKLIYNILSLFYHQRIFICLWTDEFKSVPSLINFFPSSNWFEREIWDLFGIHFINNSDLRRILTDYGFNGYPLRKDFPLSGFVELYYSSKTRLISYRKISLIQKYRSFNTKTPWNYFTIIT